MLVPPDSSSSSSRQPRSSSFTKPTSTQPPLHLHPTSKPPTAVSSTPQNRQLKTATHAHPTRVVVSSSVYRSRVGCSRQGVVKPLFHVRFCHWLIERESPPTCTFDADKTSGIQIALEDAGLVSPPPVAAPAPPPVAAPVPPSAPPHHLTPPPLPSNSTLLPYIHPRTTHHLFQTILLQLQHQRHRPPHIP
ncbi:hypothetical protein BC829DRAFT_442623 [Chytridium lagenaria]|nr:hypothetical protein BC829DRAFT_442623 [Chytridium lagenaria]